MTIALSDMLPPLTADDAKAIILPLLQVPENPVTDWYAGAVLRTMLELEALVLSDAAGGALPGVAAEGFATTAEGESLTAVALAQWDVERDTATVCVQAVVLACDALHGPYTIPVGSFFARATDGSKYVADTGGTLSTSSTLGIDMSAVSPGAMRGLVSTVLSTFPGVTISSAAVKVVLGELQLGSEAQADQPVRDACAARLPDVDFTPDEDRVIKWATEAVDTTTRYRFDPDDVNPGGVLFTVAGASGAIPGGDVTAIQDYVQLRAPVTDYITTQNASNAIVTAAGTVTVRAAIAARVKVAANAAWVAYLSTAKIGGDVFLTQLTKAVMDAGAVDFTGQTLNGVADDLVLAAAEVPVAGGDLADELTWVEV